MKNISTAAFKSWQPTFAAVTTAAFAFILMFPEHFRAWPVLIDFAKFASLGGLVAFGVASKSAWLGSNLPTSQIPDSLRDEESQKKIGMKPPEDSPSLVEGAIHEQAAKQS